MKRTAFLIGLVVLVFAVSGWAQAQAQAPKPDPALNKFDFAVGHWTYEGEYKAGPLGPGYKVTGEMAIKRILGGFFFQSQVTEKGPMGVSHVIEIFGYDPVNKNYFSNEYHDDGIKFAGAYVFNGNIFTYTGKIVADGKPIMVKMTLTIAADFMGIAGKGEISADGNTWVPWAELKYTKTKSAQTTK
jgi:hypothetical protein